MDAKTHNAKDILKEALDTIAATYWIQESEFDFVYGTYMPDTEREIDFTFWHGVSKGILAELNDEIWDQETLVEPTKGKAKITGVCSVGALALANVTLYDEPLSPWDNIAMRDLETWKAGAALAMVIITDDPDRFSSDSDPGGVIASWNDANDRTRQDVINSFTKALESPLLASAAPVELGYQEDWGWVPVHFWFADETKAQEFLDGASNLRQYLGKIYSTLNYRVIDHQALVSNASA